MPEAHAQTRAGTNRHRSVRNRRAASVWAAEVESGVVVLPTPWAGRYRDPHAAAGAGPSPTALWLSPPARHASPRRLGGESETGAPDLPGRRVDRAAHASSKAGQSSAGRATAPEPGA